MARTSFIPFDQDAEDIKAERQAERRAMRKDDSIEVEEEGLPRFGGKDPDDPEYDSLENFIEFMLDDEREQYDFGDLNCLNFRTGVRIPDIRAELAEWGLTLKRRAHERNVRGFGSNPHDRWQAAPTHGGGGGGCIMGLADAG